MLWRLALLLPTAAWGRSLKSVLIWTAVSPFYFVSNAPRELLDGVSQTLASRDQLELENRALRQELLLKNSELLMLGQYKQENARLRELWLPRCVRMSRKW
ncbi:hypothetical protein ACLK11_18680 [Escherichia coli]